MDPEDLSLQVEWGRALAWGKRYYEAAEVLEAALSRDPTSVEIGSELARIYYWAGRLDDADRVLSGIDLDAVEAAEARPLRDDVTAALAPLESEEEAEGEPADSSYSSSLEQAVRALEEEDYAAAALLYEEALRETPGDTATWRAYADLLQYRLDDLEGARGALLGLEELGASDPTLQYRLARLELWTGRNDAAKVRLQNLQADLEAGPALAAEQDSTQFGTEEAAEIRALLGDLYRWARNRALAGEAYESALRVDSTNPRAEAGLRELGAEAARTIEEVEEPGLGGNAYSLMDSDEFSRVDLGAEGVGIDGNWIWGVRTGTRWLRGLEAGGSLGTEQGFFLEMESARWWGWGSVRSGVHLGVEELQPGRRDLTIGGSLFFRDLVGFTTDVRFDHGPAYPLAVTLQSLFARAVQDRLTANVARRMAERWSLSLAGDIGRISSSQSIGTGAESSLRLEGGMSLGRSMNDRLTVGLNTRALTYTRPAPLVDGVRLFWDPRGVVASGLFAQWGRELRNDWSLSARVNPSLAFIDERKGGGYELVPHFSAESGLFHRGRRFISSMDAFYYQGRFDGYRAYGLRLSISARNWFREHGTS
jgi:tetratricopeptide (TPR) repeat protein